MGQMMPILIIYLFISQMQCSFQAGDRDIISIEILFTLHKKHISLPQCAEALPAASSLISLASPLHLQSILDFSMLLTILYVSRQHGNTDVNIYIAERCLDVISDFVISLD